MTAWRSTAGSTPRTCSSWRSGSRPTRTSPRSSGSWRHAAGRRSCGATTSTGRGPLVTNLFASRPRIAHWLGADARQLHEAYQQGARQARPMREVETGPVLDQVTLGDDVDLTALPLITHFESDLGPYITNGIIVAEDPRSGVGNLSYHRAVVLSPNTLGTSLHSRGDLWRMLEDAAERFHHAAGGDGARRPSTLHAGGVGAGAVRRRRARDRGWAPRRGPRGGADTGPRASSPGRARSTSSKA